MKDSEQTKVPPRALYLKDENTIIWGDWPNKKLPGSVRYISEQEHAALFQEAEARGREEADDWRCAFESLSRFIPETYGDEREDAVRKVKAEMERKRSNRQSWKAQQPGSAGGV